MLWLSHLKLSVAPSHPQDVPQTLQHCVPGPLRYPPFWFHLPCIPCPPVRLDYFLKHLTFPFSTSCLLFTDGINASVGNCVPVCSCQMLTPLGNSDVVDLEHCQNSSYTCRSPLLGLKCPGNRDGVVFSFPHPASRTGLLPRKGPQ